MSLSPPISSTKEGAVALIGLNGGEDGHVRLSPASLQALAEALREAADQPDIALVLLSGGRRGFCLGADLDRLLSCPPGEAQAYLALGREVMDILADLPVPTIAAVNGLALGGGFELALACDFCWAAPRAAFALPESGHGLIPAWGGIAALSRRMPQAAAWELLAGHRISAQRAWEAGLVGQVFAGPDFAGQAKAAAVELAKQGRGVLAGLKAAWRCAREEGHDRPALPACFDLVTMLRRGA